MNTLTLEEKTLSKFERRCLVCLLAWPLFWLLGIDQFIFYIFFFLEFILLLFHGRLRKSTPGLFFMAIWLLSMPAVFYVTNFLVYIKISITFLFCAIAFFVVNSRLVFGVSPRFISLIAKVTAFYISMGALLYVGGFFTGEITTLVGYLIGKTDSFFLNSISFHKFGDVVPEENSTFGFRIISLYSSYSTLSLAMLSVVPVIFFLTKYEKNRRLQSFLLLVGCVGTLILTDSRFSILILLFVTVVSFFVGSRIFIRIRRDQLAIVLVLFFLFVLVAAAVAVFLWFDDIISLFTQHRATSASTRFTIYTESISKILDNPLWGYGHPVEIPGLKSIYALGTHSSLLGVAFHFGVIALSIYVLYYLSVWRAAVFNFRRISNSRDRAFYSFVCLSLLAFNIRELADIWWWDTMLCFFYVFIVSYVYKPFHGFRGLL